MNDVEFAVLKLDDKEKRYPRYNYVAIHNSKLIFDRQFPLFHGSISDRIEELEQIERQISIRNDIPYRAEHPKDKYNLVQYQTLTTIAKIFKTKSITFDPLGSPFIIYVLRHDTDIQSLPFIPINPLLPEIKLLIFQLDKDGQMRLLTSPSDNGNDFFSDDVEVKVIHDDKSSELRSKSQLLSDIYNKKLKNINDTFSSMKKPVKKFLLVDNMIFESELTDMSKYKELPDQINEKQKFIYDDYKDFKKPVDNNFIQQILNIEDDRSPLLNTEEVNTYYKILTEFPNGNAEINSNILQLIVGEEQFDVLRQMLNNIPLEKRKSIVYNDEDMTRLMEYQLIDIIEFFIKNFTYDEELPNKSLYDAIIFIDQLYDTDEKLDSENIDFEIFKLITNNFPLDEDDAYWTSLNIARSGKIKIFDYFIYKYHVQPNKEHFKNAERSNNDEFISYLKDVYRL